METILDYLRRKLKEAGAARWGAIAEEVSSMLADERERITFHSLRKIAYGERDNPGLKDAQALLDYFQAIDLGERELPPEEAKAKT